MSKYVVTKDTEVLTDEPFVIRGQDILAQKMLKHYITELGELGLLNTPLCKGVLAHLGRLADWQDANRDKVKIPD